MNWIYVLDDSILPEGQMTVVFPLGVNIVLARIEDAIYAIEGKCVHMACPLFTGKLNGYTITCPCHDWQFDIRTGKFLDANELGLKVFPVKSETGKVYIDLNELV
jgi:3-phenylpropionate/trans-cinnamate dioxygenase ferredoxin subunit